MTARDRVGLLRDITHILARHKISMHNVTTESKNRMHPFIKLQAAFKSRTELEKIMVKLKEVKGVEEVGYKFL